MTQIIKILMKINILNIDKNKLSYDEKNKIESHALSKNIENQNIKKSLVTYKNENNLFRKKI